MSGRRASLRASFRCGGRGLWRTLRTQRNARIHVGAALAALALGLELHIPASQLAVVVVTIALVFLAEVINTAVEAVLDLLHPAQHPLAGIAKDAVAGAVLLCAIASVVVALLIFVPPLTRALGWG